MRLAQTPSTGTLRPCKEESKDWDTTKIFILNKKELMERQSGQISLIEENTSIDPEKLDIGFRVFKLDSSNLKKWNPDYDNLDSSLEEMISNYVEWRTELDVVYEIMFKYGIALTLPMDEYDINGKKLYSMGYQWFVFTDENTIDIETKDLTPYNCPIHLIVQPKPEGQKDHSILIPAYLPYEYNNCWGTGGSKIRGDEYNRIKEEAKEIIINRVCEKMGPKFRQAIKYILPSTPAYLRKIHFS